LAALRSGNAPNEVVGMLHQSPYVQYQVYEKQVLPPAMTQYAMGTVAQVRQQFQQGRQNRNQAASKVEMGLSS
ncbi:MAG: hypothetical protein F6K19_49960, partial [Cyanothece sp. SIO1E1]|nr:hypothetical protein [Cyanothece sp. SIO1E1]